MNLLLSILVITLVAVAWMHIDAKRQTLGHLQAVGQELALRVLNPQGQFLGDRAIQQNFSRLCEMLQLTKLPPILIADNKGKQVFPLKPYKQVDSSASPASSPTPNTDSGLGLTAQEANVRFGLSEILSQAPTGKGTTTLSRNVQGVGKVYYVLTSIYYKNKRVGELVLAMDSSIAGRVHINYAMLLVLIGSILLVGWRTMFILTKRLLRPLKEVAETANALKNGQYGVQFRSDIKEKEVYEMTTSIQAMADKLKELETLRKVLFAGVTHELKTPIASISGMIQAVRDGLVLDEEKEAFLNRSIQETKRLQKMVDDLLDFNGFAIGEIQAQQKLISLHDWVTEVVEQWKLADEKHQDLNVEVSKEAVSDRVLGDPLRIQQIVINLLNNAFHAVAKDGVIRVTVYVHGDGYAAVDVSDNGKGILERDRPYIFERFYRGANKRYNTGGLGLGLPYSRMLAKAQNGDLYLKSSSAEGTTFTLVLPLGGFGDQTSASEASRG